MSRIEQLIDEIEEYIEGCKPAPFSQSKIVVQKEELYELLTELRLKTPEEIKRFQKIIAQKDKIISDAQAQAEQMIEETKAYAAALVEEHEIMKMAYEKAETTINAANAQAEQIVADANAQADEVRVSALSYTQSLITNIQDVVENSLQIARTNSEGLIGGLSQNLEILVSNNEALTQQIQNKPEAPVVDETDVEDQQDDIADETGYDEEDDIPEAADEEIEEADDELDEDEEEELPVKEAPAKRFFGKKKAAEPAPAEEEDEEEEEEFDDDDYDDID